MLGWFEGEFSKISQKIQEEALAHLNCLDTGKPLSQARQEIQLASRYFEFDGWARTFLLFIQIAIRYGSDSHRDILYTKVAPQVNHRPLPWHKTEE